MILKLSGLEKRISLSEKEILNEVTTINNLYRPFLSSFSNFLLKLMDYIYHYLQNNRILEQIENREILEPVFQTMKNTKLEDTILKEKQELFMNILNKRIQFLEKSKNSEGEVKTSQDIDQILQFLLIILNRIDKKLGKFTPLKSAEQEAEFNNLISEMNEILNLLSVFQINKENSEVLSARIKNLNNKLKYKNTSFAYALIARSFKSGRLSLQNYIDLLRTKVRAEIIRAAIILTLKIYGALELKQIEDKLSINSREILENCITLLDRKEIVIKTINYINYYDIIGEAPKLHRFVSQKMQILKKNVDSLPILSKSVANAIISIATGILEKSLKIGSESDKIYDEEMQKLNESFDKLNIAFKPADFSQKDRLQREKIAAVLELYNMFRVKMVHEKEPYIVEKSGNKEKQEELDKFISNITQVDFERGLILAILRDRGPLNTQELAELSNLPRNKIVQHILRLIKDKLLISKGTVNEYFLYDIPRELKASEKHFQLVFIPLFEVIQAFINLSKSGELNLEQISYESNALSRITSNCSKLLESDIDSAMKQEIRIQLDQMDIIISKSLQLEEKLPKTKSKLDLTKLAMMPIPQTDEQHADLIEPKYLVGFGDIKWDINKCLACASCQEICPESALNLINEWDLPATFEMSEKAIEDLPENSRKLIQSIKKLAIKKPTKAIKLPKNALGFGTIKYNPIICIACRKCEDCCPNSALSFQEFWNFPQIMKNLLEEG
ncbi:MAG TPA: hypothetical protein VMV49_05000 [Candidatus Deferrimicrobium sp.]|nr:hypothetical protein [Candidatus Deferrimicrobium sp.]